MSLLKENMEIKYSIEEALIFKELKERKMKNLVWGNFCHDWYIDGYIYLHSSNCSQPLVDQQLLLWSGGMDLEKLYLFQLAEVEKGKINFHAI